jgi:uncharacterized protein (DUF924 family)
MAQEAHPIVDFWFGSITPEGEVAPEKQARWWKKSPEFDGLCREHFEAELQAIADGKLESLKDGPRGYLAYILLCDQMPRNIFRDTPKAFAWDALALAATRELIESGGLLELHPREQSFALMPLMHSEDKEVHELSLRMFEELAERGIDTAGYAKKHKDIVDRFGRYPHRNKILGRESTAEEIEFLKEPGSSF